MYYDQWLIKEEQEVGFSSLQMMKMAAFHPPFVGFRGVTYSSVSSRRPFSIIFQIERVFFLGLIDEKYMGNPVHCGVLYIGESLNFEFLSVGI